MPRKRTWSSSTAETKQEALTGAIMKMTSGETAPMPGAVVCVKHEPPPHHPEAKTKRPSGFSRNRSVSSILTRSDVVLYCSAWARSRCDFANQGELGRAISSEMTGQTARNHLVREPLPGHDNNEDCLACSGVTSPYHVGPSRERRS